MQRHGSETQGHRNRKAPSVNTPTLTRRLSLALGLAWPCSAADAQTTDAVAMLTRRADDANQAFIRGDMRRWHALVSPIADDFTLMQPLGGETSHGFDANEEKLERMAAYFQNGEATLELNASYATQDMVVLVMVERQTGEVGGLPNQDWSLRVTQIYQRRNGAWMLAHRHADPLTRNIGLERTAALARS